MVRFGAQSRSLDELEELIQPDVVIASTDPGDTYLMIRS